MSSYKYRPMEAALTPLTFSKNPSTSSAAPGVLTGRRGYGAANPIAPMDQPAAGSTARSGSARPGNRSTLNIFAPEPLPQRAGGRYGDGGDENTPPATCLSARKGYAYKNAESESQREFPKGIRRIEPPTRPESRSTIRMVAAPHTSQARSLSVVGAAMADPVPSTPRGTPRQRPPSASMSIALVLRMDETFGSKNPDDWGCPDASPYRRALPGHDLSHLQSIRLAICDHVQQRHGTLSSFFFFLSRGVVGHLGSLQQSTTGHIPLPTLAAQLSAAISTPIEVEELALIIFGQHDHHPTTVNFSNFTRAFAEGPQSALLRAHKI